MDKSSGLEQENPAHGQRDKCKAKRRIYGQRATVSVGNKTAADFVFTKEI